MNLQGEYAAQVLGLSNENLVHQSSVAHTVSNNSHRAPIREEAFPQAAVTHNDKSRPTSRNDAYR